MLRLSLTRADASASALTSSYLRSENRVMLGGTLDGTSTLVPVLLLLAYPIHLLLMAAVLAICGVPREDIAKWALKQAGRERFISLIQVARGQGPAHDPRTAAAPQRLSAVPESALTNSEAKAAQ